MFSTGSLRAAVAVVLLGFGLTACGTDSASDQASDGPTTASASSSSAAPSPQPTSDSSSAAPSASPAPAGTPSCSQVWQDQGTLPRVYLGCADRQGDLVASDRLSCSSGQRMVRFDDRFYAFPGGVIHEVPTSLERDRQYRDTVARCRA